MISIIIPFQENQLDKGYRERNFKYVVNQYQRYYPDAQIVQGEDFSGYESFCRSHAINDGVKGSSGDILIISDADILFYKRTMDKAIQALQKCPFIIPFGRVVDLSRSFSDRLTKQNPTYTLRELREGAASIRDIRVGVSHWGDKSAGGVQVITRDLFNKVGGYDERFKGWGWEDTVFCWKIRKELGDYDILSTECVYHLWHPRNFNINNHNQKLALKLKKKWRIEDERNGRLPHK